MPTPTFSRISALLFAANICAALAQPAKRPNEQLATASPFGIEIGRTTCSQSAELLKRTPSKVTSSIGTLSATVQATPGGYPGSDFFVVTCDRGLDMPVTSATLVMLGDLKKLELLLLDLASKYKPVDPEKIVNSGIEFLVNNGNVRVYIQNTHEPSPREILIQVEYSSIAAINRDRDIEKKRRNDAQTEESARRKLL